MTTRTLAILSLFLSLPVAVAGGRGRTSHSERRRGRARWILRVRQTRRVRRDRRLARTRLAGYRRCPAGPVRLAVHARADRDPGPAVAPDPAGERAGRGRAAARPYPADPSRRARRRANPGDLAKARLHHGALLHRHDRRALADRRDGARQPLPAAGPGGRAGSGQSRRGPSALSGAPTGLSRRQRGGDAGRSRRAVGGRPARNRRCCRLPGRYPPRHARAERRSDRRWRSPKGFHAGDPVLLGLLGGAVPPDAERLAVEGGGHEGRAWRQGGDLLLVTRAYLLSPGPWAAERGSGGRWAYRLPDTPQALVSVRGREIRLSFRSMEITTQLQDIDDEQ